MSFPAQSIDPGQPRAGAVFVAEPSTGNHPLGAAHTDGFLPVTIPALGPAQRGRLGLHIEAAVETALDRRGCAPPGIGAATDLETSLGDQLYRARLVGAQGLVLMFERLEGAANPPGNLDPEDSAVLRWWVAASREKPVRLLLNERDRELGVFGPAVALHVLLSESAGAAQPQAPQAAPEVAASMATMDLSSTPLQVGPASATPDRPRNPRREGPRTSSAQAMAALFADAKEDVRTALRSSPQSALPGGFPPSPEPTIKSLRFPESAPPAVPVSLPVEDEPVDGQGEPDEPDTNPLVFTPSPDGDDGADDRSPSAPRLPPVTEAALAAEAASPAPLEPATPTVPDVPEALPDHTEPENLEEGDTEGRELTVEVAPSRTLLNDARRDSVVARDETVAHDGAVQRPGTEPLEGSAPQNWRSWMRELDAARGPKPLSAIERLFVSCFVPLQDAVALGIADETARPVLETWAASFAKSYSEAFDALRLRGKRPTMVLDVPDIAHRMARLHGARSVQLLLVDGMRFDLGLRMHQHLRTAVGQHAALTERLLLWSALPTTTQNQLELLGRGPEGLRDMRQDAESTLPVARGKAAALPRRVRVGSRDLFKLDVVEARAAEGPVSIARMEEIAREAGAAIAHHLERIQERTLVVVFGDHGFRTDAEGRVTQGGSSPEEVLVPAFAWLVGNIH